MMNTGVFADPLSLLLQSRSLCVSPLCPLLTPPSTELCLGQSGFWRLEAKAEEGQERSRYKRPEVEGKKEPRGREKLADQKQW